MSSTLTLLISLLLAFAAPAAAQTASGISNYNSPAAQRLVDLLATINSGSSQRIRAYLREFCAPEVCGGSNEDRIANAYLALYNRSRGLQIDSLQATRTEAATLLRAELTGLTERLSIRLEPGPPHRILGPASFEIEPPKHFLSRPGARDAERVLEIERIARTLAEADAFSGAVLLARGDSVLYVGAFGDADKERGIPIRPETRFGIASITKTFATVATAKLVEEGKLSWDERLGTFFPNFPLAEARAKIRIKHLVTHTSGLREGFPERPDSMEDYVRAVALAQEDSLLYEPGTRSIYTNANFELLGAIIEQASGLPFYEYIRMHVFRPGGMEETGFLELEGVPEPFAFWYQTQYTDRGARIEERRPNLRIEEYPAAFAGAYSTAGDLFRFARSLASGRILAPGTVRLLFSPKPEAGNWGYGFDILDEERGLVGHGGSWFGHSHSLDLFTRSGYILVILSNYTLGRSPLREAIWAILP